MKKVIILLNGEPYFKKIEAEDAYVICCDGAYEWAKNKVKIDETLGDFDSLGYLPSPPPSKIYPSEKDLTDGEIALERALELKADSVVIYGGGGGREDHFLGNLHLLYKFCTERAAQCALMITNGAHIYACGAGAHSFPCQTGQTVSIVPFGGNAHILNSDGLKYPLKDLTLPMGSTRGISNLTEREEFSLFVERGFVFVILNQREGESF